MTSRIGLVGARGFTGRELLRLIAAHPELELALACSGSAAGKPVRDVAPELDTDLTFVAPDPSRLADLDAVVLALPNEASAPYVEAAADEQVVVDLSADHRFDDRWAYGLPERRRATLRGARRIANPGCYATGAQLAIGPLVEVLRGEPVIFGVSGYSGAGAKPSRKNDLDVLKDNLVPYAPQGHVHEREVSRHLGHRVRFHPHVAAWFQGIALTVSMSLTRPLDLAELDARYRAAYDGEPLVDYGEVAPEVRDISGRPGAAVGGLTVDDEGRVVVVATLDNLLKGAAVQALQNLNLALGYDELTGIAI
jgi:N-acetyl-gamma-glutamyl-phosphate reductase common form